MHYFIGIMSGTSLDGIDVVIADLEGNKPNIIAAETYLFSASLKTQLHQLINRSDCHLADLGSADIALGQEIAQSINTLLQNNHLKPADIKAIGSHGQTIYHQPVGTHRFSMQIGNPNIIVEETGITTVADFRQRDMALGGQGAPLVPSFHQALFQDETASRVILNIGGISNITVLPATNKNTPVFGFDTGPGNTLMDAWCQQHKQQPFDSFGEWAQSGKVNKDLLNVCLSDNYFSQPTPKSTGREYFNLKWLDAKLQMLEMEISPTDIQATLSQLSAETIAADIKSCAADVTEVYLCGGGAFNSDLINRLGKALPLCTIKTTDILGLAPAWVEATAFAWFAKQTINQKTVNLSTITGASKNTLLGGIYYSSNDNS